MCLVFFFFSFAPFSGKVHEFLALNKLSSPQLPTRKLKFQVRHSFYHWWNHHCLSGGARREDGIPQQKRNIPSLASLRHLDTLVSKVALSKMHMHTAIHTHTETNGCPRGNCFWYCLCPVSMGTHFLSVWEHTFGGQRLASGVFLDFLFFLTYFSHWLATLAGQWDPGIRLLLCP